MVNSSANRFMSSGSVAALLMAMGVAAPGAALAQSSDSSGSTIQEVVVTGTRTTGVTAANSAAPVQIVGKNALTNTGGIDLSQALTASVPSLNIDTTGGDMAALSIQASLRGLSPNDTLVLINGMRRHDTSNLAVDGGSPYSGSATVDLSFIPVDAIDHVEVLTDGAAAQYGTDAIAGVVNIILKRGASGGNFTGTGGAFYTGQGATGAFAINKGFNLGQNGFLNVTLEEKYHTFTYAGVGDERFQGANGAVLPTCTGSASEGDTFPPACLQSPDTNVTQSQKYPYENRVNGDPAYHLYNGLYNGGYDVSPDMQVYSFGSIGYRLAEHYENYRAPSLNEATTSTGATVDPTPLGFDPMEQIKELDYSFTAGVKGKLSDWTYNLATTYGDNHVDVYVINSANNVLYAGLQSLSSTQVPLQTNFYDGSFDTTQWTNTLDLNRNFNVGMAEPLNVAVGAEFRKETYTLGAGEAPSYVDGGVQSFFGYSPLDASSHSRTNYAFYTDLAASPIAKLHVDLAGRFEHYSDFGSAEVGKLTARYDFSAAFALRGTVSNGFRAPTLAEEYYSGTNVGPNQAEAQLPPNSPAAKLAGFEPLKPEKSVNLSIGAVAHPLPRLQVTVDAYNIQLNNRIEVTNSLQGLYNGELINSGILDTVAARGVTIQPNLRSVGFSAFANAASTNTSGVDLTANYASDFSEFGHVDWTVGFNWNHTYFTKLASLPGLAATPAPTPLPAHPTAAQVATYNAQEAAYAEAQNLGQTPGSPLLTGSALSALTTMIPEEKTILQALWTKDKWSVNLRETIYGRSSSIAFAPGANGAEFIESIPITGITDLDVGFKLTSFLKIDLGANNLFNTLPPKAPVIGGQPADGGLVFNLPYTFSPWGINGGYYYGRVTLTF
jgi:iron complex outermembrane receptor protein